MRVREPILASLFVTGVIVNAAVLGVSLQARADGDPATDAVPRVIAYNGTLEFDGEAFNGPVEMQFDVYDGADSPAAVWTEQYFGESRAVSVYNGAFEVQLGRYATNLASIIAGADDLYLTVSIRNPDGTLVALSGRQRFTPAPYSMWAARGSDFTVERDLFVDRNADVTGTTRLRGAVTADSGLNVTGNTSTTGTLSSGGNATVGGTLGVGSNATVGGTLGVTGAATLNSTLSVSNTTTLGHALSVSRNVTANAWTPRYANWDSLGTGDGGAAIYNDSGSYDALMIAGNTASGAAGRRIQLYDDVTINGNLAVNGRITNLYYTGEYSTDTIGENNSNAVDMTSTANSFCFLTLHRAPDDNDEDDLNQCWIDVNGSFWRLNVYTTSDDNWRTQCNARCFVFDG